MRTEEEVGKELQDAIYQYERYSRLLVEAARNKEDTEYTARQVYDYSRSITIFKWVLGEDE